MTPMLNPLPNDKILASSKLKAFADHKTTEAKIIIFIIDRPKNIVGKGENADFSHNSF